MTYKIHSDHAQFITARLTSETSINDMVWLVGALDEELQRQTDTSGPYTDLHLEAAKQTLLDDYGHLVIDYYGRYCEVHPDITPEGLEELYYLLTDEAPYWEDAYFQLWYEEQCETYTRWFRDEFAADGLSDGDILGALNEVDPDGNSYMYAEYDQGFGVYLPESIWRPVADAAAVHLGISVIPVA